MRSDQLHVFTARFNPLRWEQPDAIFREWCDHIIASGAHLHIAELQYGEREYRHADIPGAHHVGFRADSWAWSKENLLNLLVQRVPEADYICWSDADIFHRKAGWAAEIVEALQHYRVVQTWSKALDLGPNDELLQVHHSFAGLHMDGKPVVPMHANFWKFDGGCYEYAHSGYQWACIRELLDWTGGLFELGGMGSGDHHMALSLVGAVEKSWAGGVSDAYKGHLFRWQERARRFVNGRLGAVHGTIEHRWHGRKVDRNYLGRWDMFLKHGFNPDTDLKRNSLGVWEWAGNKPELEREWDRYLRARNEDANTVG